jgi:hypothetical protein
MITAFVLYALGFSMTYFGFTETEDEKEPTPIFNVVLSFAWPLVAVGMLCYMIFKTFKK